MTEKTVASRAAGLYVRGLRARPHRTRSELANFRALPPNRRPPSREDHHRSSSFRIGPRVVVAAVAAVATAGLALAQQSAPVIGTLDGHTDPVYAIAWSPDGKTLVTGGFDNTVRLWDAASRKELKRFDGHSEAAGPGGRAGPRRQADPLGESRQDGQDLGAARRWSAARACRPSGGRPRPGAEARRHAGRRGLGETAPALGPHRRHARQGPDRPRR